VTRERGQLPERLRDSPTDGRVYPVGGVFYGEVHGQPIPQGSKKAGIVGYRANGSPYTTIMDSNSHVLKPWRQKVAKVCYVSGWVPMSGPLLGVAVFWFEPPKSWDGATPPHTKSTCDLDKLCRALGDGLSDAGVWEDDSRCSTWCLEKAYVGQPWLTLQAYDLPRLDTPGVAFAVSPVTIPGSTRPGS
jgi:Holliday junction resolvase RusA-like endonuclease